MASDASALLYNWASAPGTGNRCIVVAHCSLTRRPFLQILALSLHFHVSFLEKVAPHLQGADIDVRTSRMQACLESLCDSSSKS